MFVKAIEEVAKYTRPIHTISRIYKEKIVTPGSATFFFVNELGVAITCKHVIDLIGKRKIINDHYDAFKKEKEEIGKTDSLITIEDLEKKYNFKEDALIQLNELFSGVSTDKTLNYRWISHPKYDLAIIMFDNFQNPAYQSHAVFMKDTTGLKQGKFLCRLGYPFPEFQNYRFNEDSDSIEWTNEGLLQTPFFPIEGMLTRILAEPGKVVGLELSTPGLRGQSGGPLFDAEGLVCGMQSSTNHLHLGFDMKNFEYNAAGKFININNQPFLHVGHCVHVDIIKDFLTANGVKFYEG